MEVVSHATSASNQTNLSVLMPSSLVTQSTEPSKNTVSQRPHTLPEFLKNAILTPSLQFSVPASLYTKDSKNLVLVPVKQSLSLVPEVV